MQISLKKIKVSGKLKFYSMNINYMIFIITRIKLMIRGWRRNCYTVVRRIGSLECVILIKDPPFESPTPHCVNIILILLQLTQICPKGDITRKLKRNILLQADMPRQRRIYIIIFKGMKSRRCSRRTLSMRTKASCLEWARLIILKKPQRMPFQKSKVIDSGKSLRGGGFTSFSGEDGRSSLDLTNFILQEHSISSSERKAYELLTGRGPKC